MIILTQDEANQVRGQTTLGHALAPRPLVDGTFVLPEAVLSDPAHEKHWKLLSTLPTVPDGSIRKGEPENPTEINSPIINSDFEQDPTITSLVSYSEDWKVGEVVAVDLVQARARKA